MNKTDITKYIYKQLQAKLGEHRTKEIMDEDIDFIGSGIMSSLDFISLLSDIEQEFDIEIDFEDYDPSEYSTMSGLISITLTSR